MEISAPSQMWTPDGGRDHVFDILTFQHLNFFNDVDGKKEKSSAAMVKADLGQRRRASASMVRPGGSAAGDDDDDLTMTIS